MARLGLILGGVIATASLTVVGLTAAQPPAADPIGKLVEDAEAAAPKAEDPAAPAASPATNTAAAADPQADAAPAKAPAPKTAPDRRPRYPIAILQALDKVTAESMRFEVPIGQPVRYRNLVFTVRSCETTTAKETASDAIAFVEVEARNPNPARAAPLQRQIFKGWMFAASPSVNPLTHPVYDAWLIACKA